MFASQQTFVLKRRFAISSVCVDVVNTGLASGNRKNIFLLLTSKHYGHAK